MEHFTVLPEMLFNVIMFIRLASRRKMRLVGYREVTGKLGRCTELQLKYLKAEREFVSVG